MKHWRTLLARIPLPMLALAASYGVYSFASLFVPWQVAIIQAAAFELTYIGLAVTLDLSEGARRRATTISIGAVVASIIYNTLSGWFHRQPQLLDSASPLAWLMFAILHGAPLAWVAYLVSDLLLHSGSVALPELPPAQEAPHVQIQTSRPIEDRLYPCPNCGTELLLGAYGAAIRNRYCKACKNSVVMTSNGKEH